MQESTGGVSQFRANFVEEPIVAPLAQMELMTEGTEAMIEWCKTRAPACLPESIESTDDAINRMALLFPHGMLDEEEGLHSGNELLVELAGRKCYNSFGEKAGRKSNREYIANMQVGDTPHRSVLYHAKMAFFIAGVSRRVSHELIRNYVGSDRTEEGSPSQESTRYVEHAGFYVVHPRYLESSALHDSFATSAHANYREYREAINFELITYQSAHGKRPTGIDYKRILEAASSRLLHSVETSFVWTTNPEALAKLFRERDHDLADLEFRRLAKKWKKLCLAHWPNLFPQPWMQEGA